MTSKALTWIAVVATIAALASPNIFAIDMFKEILHENAELTGVLIEETGASSWGAHNPSVTHPAAPSFAPDYTHNTPGLSGYDPVAYFTDGKSMRGSGYHVTVHDGVTYPFTTEEHKKIFEVNPHL